MVNIYLHGRHDTCTIPSLPDRKTSRTALQFLRSFLQPLFFALFLSCGSQHVCVCVCYTERLLVVLSPRRSSCPTLPGPRKQFS